MRPDSFIMVVKYEKDSQHLEVMLDDSFSMHSANGGTVKEILEFLQRVIILQFCRGEGEEEAPMANEFNKIIEYMGAGKVVELDEVSSEE